MKTLLLFTCTVESRIGAGGAEAVVAGAVAAANALGTWGWTSRSSAALADGGGPGRLHDRQFRLVWSFHAPFAINFWQRNFDTRSREKIDWLVRGRNAKTIFRRGLDRKLLSTAFISRSFRSVDLWAEAIRTTAHRQLRSWAVRGAPRGFRSVGGSYTTGWSGVEESYTEMLHTTPLTSRANQKLGRVPPL